MEYLECLECKKHYEAGQIFGLHLRNVHGLSQAEYQDKHGIRRHCSKCNAPLRIKYKGAGLCKACSDNNRDGANNPFFGKHQDRATIEATKIKLRAISQGLWQNESYRQKIISGVSKPRREGFKAEQSKRIKQWYQDNPEQKVLRSGHMTDSWRQGKIEPNINSINESKLEKTLRAMLESSLPGAEVTKKTIRLAGRWFYPDVIIDGKHIVEFYGTMWHADPRYYDSGDVVHHHLTAKQIWDGDQKREKILRDAGYNVIVVWQREFIGKEQAVVDRVKALIENSKGVQHVHVPDRQSSAEVVDV